MDKDRTRWTKLMLLVTATLGFAMMIAPNRSQAQPAKNVVPAGDAARKLGVTSYRVLATGQGKQVDLLAHENEVGRLEILREANSSKLTLNWKLERINVSFDSTGQFALYRGDSLVAKGKVGVTNQSPLDQYPEQFQLIEGILKDLGETTLTAKNACGASEGNEEEPATGYCPDQCIVCSADLGPRGFSCDFSRSIACDGARVDAGQACSNFYCWGCCDFDPCDCVCAAGDYLCCCGVNGYRCACNIRPSCFEF